MDEMKMTISQSFYTQPLMILTAAAAAIFAFVHRKKFKELQLLFFYPTASVIQMLVFYWSITTQDSDKVWFVQNVSGNIFIVTEFVILCTFFFQVVTEKILKKIVYISALVFSLYVCYLWFCANSFTKNPVTLFLPESLCILCFCFIYFYQLFRLPPTSYLLNSASFWLTIGCLFYFSCTIPLFFADSVLASIPSYNSMYAINYLGYTILFLFLIKALSCRRTQTTL